MRNIAKIQFSGGGVLLPAHGPYERELIFETADRLARRHGSSRVELDRRVWSVTVTDDSDRRNCPSCGSPHDTLRYRYLDLQICPRCARKHSTGTLPGTREPVAA